MFQPPHTIPYFHCFSFSSVLYCLQFKPKHPLTDWWGMHGMSWSRPSSFCSATWTRSVLNELDDSGIGSTFVLGPDWLCNSCNRTYSVCIIDSRPLNRCLTEEIQSVILQGFGRLWWLFSCKCLQSALIVNASFCKSERTGWGWECHLSL